MKYVEIFRLQNDGSQKLIATCKLTHNTVVCEGDQNFCDQLIKEGIKDYTVEGKKLLPNEGIKFLEQLKYYFRSGYLMATGVKEQ